MASSLCSCYEEKKLSKQRKRIRGGSGVGILKKGSQNESKKMENNALGLLLQPGNFLHASRWSKSFSVNPRGSCPSGTFLGGPFHYSGAPVFLKFVSDA